MAATRISALTLIAAASITATSVLPMTTDKVGLVTDKVQVQQLRTAMFAGGTGYANGTDILSLGTAPPAAGLIRLDGGTVTVTTPLLSAIQTWNAGGVAFTGFLLNVTNTASAAASYLIDLQVGGASKWHVDVTGAGTLANGLTVTAGGLTVSAGTTAVQALTATGNIDLATTKSITGSTLSLLKNNGGNVQIGDGASNLILLGSTDLTGMSVNDVRVGGKLWVVGAVTATTGTFSSEVVARDDLLGRFQSKNTAGSTVLIAGTYRAWAGGATSVTDGAIGVAANLAFFTNNTTVEVGRMTSGGVFAWGTTVTTGASAGDIVLANNSALRGVTSVSSGTVRIALLDSNNLVQINPGGSGNVGPCLPAIAVAAMPASNAIYAGAIHVSTTNSDRIVFYGSTGTRYYLTGTAF